MSNRGNGDEGTEVAAHNRSFHERLERVERLVFGGDDDELARKSLVRRMDAIQTLLKWAIRISLGALVPILALIFKALAGVVAQAIAK